MFAPLPGVSRSGLTISAALALGFSRTWAVNFSLMMAVPAILGATVFELRKVDPSTLTGERVAQIVASAALAGVIGYLAIVWLLRLVRSGRLWYFSVYLVLLGIGLIAADQTRRGRRPDARPAQALDRPLRDVTPGSGDRRGPRPSRRASGWSPRRWPASRSSRALAIGRRGSSRPGSGAGTTPGAVARAQTDVPARLSAAGLMAVLAEAIERPAARAGRSASRTPSTCPAIVANSLARFAAWTRDERPVDGPPPGDSAVDVEEWAVFRRYRETLRELDAEDPEGWAVWASRTLAKQPPPELRKPGQVVVIDPIAPDLAPAGGSSTIATSGPGR